MIMGDHCNLLTLQLARLQNCNDSNIVDILYCLLVGKFFIVDQRYHQFW